MPNRRGFSLLETLVALAILGSAVVVVLQTFSSAAGAARRSEAYTRGLALAEVQMEDLLSVGRQRLLALDGAVRTFPTPDDRYFYAVSVVPVPGRSLLSVHLRVTWEDAGGGRLDLVTRTRGTAETVGF